MTQDFPNLGFNPAPGDPDTLRRLVSTVGRVTREGNTAQSELSKLGTSDGIWVGKSAAAFTDSVSDIPPYLRNALSSLTTAQRALESYERSLTGYQARARRLEQEAAGAARSVSTAQKNVDGLPADTEGMSGKEKDEYEKDKKARQTALTSATEELEAVRRRARTLNAEFVTTGDETARRIRDAADNAPPEPGWFEEALGGIGGFFSDAWEVISDPDLLKLIGDICADIAMVVGVVCLAILVVGLFVSGVGVPFALGLIGTIAAAGALGGHAAAMAAGHPDVTLTTLAWDAAGLLAGGIGLRGAMMVRAGGRTIAAGENMVEGGAAMARAGQTLRSTEGLAAQLGKAGNFQALTPSTWGNLRYLSPGNLNQGLRNSLEGISQAARGRSLAVEGQRAILEGTKIVSKGRFRDLSGLYGGLTASGGSNLNDQRWLSDDFDISDLPVVGPIADFPGIGQPPGGAAAAPEPFDAPARLTSAGGSFVGGLDRPQPGTAV